MNAITNKLYSIQGRLFELSAKQGLESNEFVKAYMNSDIAAKFNSAYDRSQWMGEEYLLEELSLTFPIPTGKTYSADIMFWMGYTYAFWAIAYGDSCKNIVKTANPKVMAENYAGLHTVSADMAIQDLKSQYWSRGNNGAKLKDEVIKKILSPKNGHSGTEYQNQLNRHRQYVNKRMNITYIDHILELIEKADIPPKEKAEYSYVVKDMTGNVINNGFSETQFLFLNSLEKKLKS